MPDNFLEIDTSHLEKTIADLSTQLERLRAAKSHLFEQLQQLDTTWDGPAKAVFLSQFTSDDDTMDGLCREISILIQALQSAKSQYESCESSIHDTICSIRITN